MFSLKPPDKIRPVKLTDTFLHVPLKGLHLTFLTFYSAPSQQLHQPQKNSEEQNTRAEQRKASEENGTQRDGEKGRSRGRGETVFLGSKAIVLPSTLIHSLCATLAPGGMGVACHWCHSPVNHSVTGSDGLRVVERKPPAKRHMR